MKYIGQDEISAMLSVPNIKSIIGYRDFCILLLMVHYGIRIIDIINLKLSDVNWDTGEIAIARRDEFVRRIDLSKGDFSALQGLLYKCADYSKTAPLFTTPYGNKLTKRQIVQMVRDTSDKAQVNVKSKDLCATYIADRLVVEDIKDVAESMGYSKPHYLKKYAKLKTEAMPDKETPIQNDCKALCHISLF